MDLDERARIHAQRLWNATPCGSVAADIFNLDYFERVRERRYCQQPWMFEVFPFRNARGLNVLEIGVGQGTDLVQFGLNGARCFGADITDAHLELTRLNFQLRGLDVVLKKCDATRLDFQDGFFDLVYTFGVLHHIPEIDLVLQEIHRVLKPGGKLIFSVYSLGSAFFIFSKIIRQGLIGGDLFRIGYKGLKATIEEGADGINTVPYVDLYTKRSIDRLLKKDYLIMKCCKRHLFFQHFAIPFTSRLPNIRIQSLENLWGWFLIYEAAPKKTRS
jgi:SAM-dependent methyltransferase